MILKGKRLNTYTIGSYGRRTNGCKWSGKVKQQKYILGDTRCTMAFFSALPWLPIERLRESR